MQHRILSAYLRIYVCFPQRPDIRMLVCVHERRIYINVDAHPSAPIILLEVYPPPGRSSSR